MIRHIFGALTALGIVACSDVLGADFEHTVAREGSADRSAAEEDAAAGAQPGCVRDDVAYCGGRSSVDAAPEASTTDANANADANASDAYLVSDAHDATTPPTCDEGQRLVGNTCICDAASCTRGCCSGTTCVWWVDYTTPRFCGPVGGTCSTCAANEVCSEAGECVSDFVEKCFPNLTSTSLELTCDDVCGGISRTCARGCFSDYEDVFPAVERTGNCNPTATVWGAKSSCSGTLTIGPGKSMYCCCS